MSFEKAEIAKLLEEGKTAGISLCQIIWPLYSQSINIKMLG